jgi:hypothetical protein
MYNCAILQRYGIVRKSFHKPTHMPNNSRPYAHGFIWQGATLRVPVTTLQRPKHEAG